MVFDTNLLNANVIENKSAYVIRDSEAGNVIDRFESFIDAMETLIAYEKHDKLHGDYVEGFYEIAREVADGVYEKVYDQEVSHD